MNLVHACEPLCSLHITWVYTLLTVGILGVDTAKCKQSSSKLRSTSNRSLKNWYPSFPLVSIFKIASTRVWMAFGHPTREVQLSGVFLAFGQKTLQLSWGKCEAIGFWPSAKNLWLS